MQTCPNCNRSFKHVAKHLNYCKAKSETVPTPIQDYDAIIARYNDLLAQVEECRKELFEQKESLLSAANQIQNILGDNQQKEEIKISA